MTKIIIICVAVVISFFISQNVNSKTTRASKPPITEYEIISGTSLGMLQRNVSSEVGAGWVPSGGILYDQKVYVQAMVK